MAMGNRPDVQTAPAPIVALDVSLLAQQLATALARVPFRHPFEGSPPCCPTWGSRSPVR